LQGIAESIPIDMRVFIIFESWSNQLNLAQILAGFGGRAMPFKLVTCYPWSPGWPKILRLLVLPFNRRVVSRLIPLKEGDSIGDLIIEVSNRSDKTT